MRMRFRITGTRKQRLHMHLALTDMADVLSSKGCSAEMARYVRQGNPGADLDSAVAGYSFAIAMLRVAAKEVQP